MAIGTSEHTSAQILYALHADDGTNFQVRSGVTTVAAVNKAGTITCDMGTVPANFAAIVNSSGTTTLAFTCADAGSGIMNLLAQAASTLTETTLELHYSILLNDPAVVTPQ